MNYEPLNHLLSLYDISNHDTILKNYLNDNINSFLNDYNYVTDLSDLFLNDRVIIIIKSTGKLYKQGYIIKIKENYIIIKTNLTNIKINIKDYYIFNKNKKYMSNKSKRKYYEELLNSLS